MPVELIITSVSNGQEILCQEILPDNYIQWPDYSYDPPRSVWVGCKHEDDGGDIKIFKNDMEPSRLGGKARIVKSLVKIHPIPSGEEGEPITIKDENLDRCVLAASHFIRISNKTS